MRLTLLFAFLMLATGASATGIGVVPAELDFELEKGEKSGKTLTVYNLGSEIIELEVNSPADHLRFYHNLTVPANGNEKIFVEVLTGDLGGGNYTNSVYVTTRNSAEGVKFNLGAAVKVSVNVINSTKANPVIGILVSTTILLTGILAYFAATRLPRIFSGWKA